MSGQSKTPTLGSNGSTKVNAPVCTPPVPCRASVKVGVKAKWGIHQEEQPELDATPLQR